MTDLSKAPERIWLQDSGDWCEDSFFAGEITWCDHAVNEEDTEYVRADILETLIAAGVREGLRMGAERAYQWWEDDDAQELREHVRANNPDAIAAAVERVKRQTTGENG